MSVLRLACQVHNSFFAIWLVLFNKIIKFYVLILFIRIGSIIFH